LNISVIVPFFNEEKYIRQSIESLRNQDFERSRYELIFVDNNSTDGSRAIVEEYADVILLSEERPGAYAARNRGAMQAHGAILAFTDADVSVEKDWLAEIENWITAGEVDFVIGNHCFAENASQFLKFYEHHESQKMEYVTRCFDQKYCLNSAANMAIKKEFFNLAGMFNPDIARGGDIEFVQRYVKKMSHPRIAYNRNMIVHHNEIRNLWDWFKKRRVYAQSRARIRRDYAVRPLPFPHRIRVFAKWFRHDPAPAYQKSGFVFVLLMGVLSWKCIEWFVMATHNRQKSSLFMQP